MILEAYIAGFLKEAVSKKHIIKKTLGLAAKKILPFGAMGAAAGAGASPALAKMVPYTKGWQQVGEGWTGMNALLRPQGKHFLGPSALSPKGGTMGPLIEKIRGGKAAIQDAGAWAWQGTEDVVSHFGPEIATAGAVGAGVAASAVAAPTLARGGRALLRQNKIRGGIGLKRKKKGLLTSGRDVLRKRHTPRSNPLAPK